MLFYFHQNKNNYYIGYWMFKQITEIKSLEIIIWYLMFNYNVFVVTKSRNKTITIK